MRKKLRERIEDIRMIVDRKSAFLNVALRTIGLADRLVVQSQPYGRDSESRAT